MGIKVIDRFTNDVKKSVKHYGEKFEDFKSVSELSFFMRLNINTKTILIYRRAK